MAQQLIFKRVLLLQKQEVRQSHYIVLYRTLRRTFQSSINFHLCLSSCVPNLDTLIWWLHLPCENNRSMKHNGRSQWPRGLRRGSAAARLLGLRIRIPLGAWISVSCECCVLSGRCLCVGLITRQERPYRVVSLAECDREPSTMMRPWATRGCCAMKKKMKHKLCNS
jgi:hypothetical protein